MNTYRHLDADEMVLVVNGYHGHFSSRHIVDNIVCNYRTEADKPERAFLLRRVEIHLTNFRKGRGNEPSIDSEIITPSQHIPGREENQHQSHGVRPSGNYRSARTNSTGMRER